MGGTLNNVFDKLGVFFGSAREENNVGTVC